MTRVAAGDPALYGQIVAANAEAVLDLLAEVREPAGRRDRRRRRRGPGRRWSAARGGRRRHPGHPGQARRPGAADARRSSCRCPTTPASWPGCSPTPGASEVNIEDVHIDHDPGRPVGLVELVVDEGRAEHLLGLSGIPGLGHSPVGLPAREQCQPRRIVVAVDGTSGSGKSSTSRGVADRLGLRYLDTGAMYRAMTWWMLRHGVDVHDPAAVAARCAEPRIESGTDPLGADHHRRRRGRRRAIRSDDVNAAVSPVSAVPEVRARLLGLQRAAIEAASAGPGSWSRAATSARSSGPEAPVKVYLTADPRPRAPRAARPRRAAPTSRPTRESLLARDRIDSGRAVSPLVMAEGAVHIDTTPYTLDEVIDQVVALVEPSDRERRAMTDRHAQRAAAQRPNGTRPRYLLHPLRPLARCVIRRRVEVRVHDGEKRAARRAGDLRRQPRRRRRRAAAGDLRAAAGARADQAGDVRGRWAGSCSASGQIPLDRFNTDPRRSSAACGCCATASASGSSPRAPAARASSTGSTRGAAYLALVSGAPVVPVDAVRHPRARRRQPARCRPRAEVVDMVFGAPFTFAQRRGRAPSTRSRKRPSTLAGAHARPPRPRRR